MPADSDEYSSSKRGRKKKDRADREEKKSRHHQAPESEQPSVENVPSVEEVCETHELNDVGIEYTTENYENLVTQKMFSSYVRPILQKENSKAPSSKVSLLVAAKWREFCEENPNLREEDPIGGPTNEPEAELENSEEEQEEELEYQPKPSRSRASRGAAKKEESDDNELDDDEDEPKKRSSARNVTKRGRKQKVPTLKIKFGKKKNQSSDEEKVKNEIRS